MRLFSDHRVMGIVGPMGSAVATAAAREAQKLGVPIMTITQREGITSLGDYVFRHFLTADMQMKALMRYAVENLGMKRFAILYPDDHYGAQMAHLFWDEVLAAEGEIRGVERYDTNKTDFSDEIKALTGLAYVDEDEGKEEPQPIVDFDALFIPDSYTRLSMIAPQLAFYNVTGIQLLGTNALNTSDRPEGENEYIDGTVFVDSFFLNSYYPVVRDFIDRFYVACGREPTDLEALVYDAARIMVTALTDPRVEVRDDLQAILRDMKDYHGVTGVTSFQSGGDVEKSLSVLMLRNNNIVQVK
ncbi:MAG: penicillin-binding protein activator [Deltaproteobacteria bacterium]|nr:penicillin-binding protein activator [Deltaproteobacteria bacterium]